MSVSFDINQPFAFGVCRIEPENNVHLLLEAFSEPGTMPLVIVGNWAYSEYGKRLKVKYQANSSIIMHDPIYDQAKLNALRSNCTLYLHGHSCGGTNPSLVEAMYLRLAIAAYDCNFNRETTENKAFFFKTAEELRELVHSLTEKQLQQVADCMKEIADRRYTWKRIAECYAKLL